MLWAEEELVQPTPLSEQDGAKIGRKSVSTCVKCEVWGLSFRSSKRGSPGREEWTQCTQNCAVGTE